VSIFKVGDKVGTGGDSQTRSVRRTRGRVVEVNTSDDEVGMKFGAASRHDEVTTWFRPSELEPGSSLHAHACAPIAPRPGFPLRPKPPERLQGYSPVGARLPVSSMLAPSLQRTAGRRGIRARLAVVLAADSSAI
jgi:hypothetical protein